MTNNELLAALPALLPKAIGWAEAMEKDILARGQPLTARMVTVARIVGVGRPEDVRILEVDRIPMPENEELRQAAMVTGLFNPDITGMTFGHGIVICKGHWTTRLVSHELRHVHQYEAAGSVAAFLPVYLHQVAVHGYHDAPLERDARGHETTVS
nr:hypothetical protein [Curvibacter delicatus]